MPSPCWIDGRIVPGETPLYEAGDSAVFEGRGCYSTTRIVAGRPRFAERHARRLRRNAEQLGIGVVDEADCVRALRELGEAAFGSGDGVVRIQASRALDGRVRLVGIARELGEELETWRAITLPFCHEGAVSYAGAKVTNRLVHTLAGDAVDAAGVQEGLLFDSQNRLVEGTRANLMAVTDEGEAVVPPLSRGAVAGVTLEIVRELLPQLKEMDIHRDQVHTLRELVALNAARGARPITELDGKPVADGNPGPWSQRLADALETAARGEHR